MNLLLFYAKLSDMSDVLLTNQKYVRNSTYISKIPLNFIEISLCDTDEIIKSNICIKSIYFNLKRKFCAVRKL